MGFHIRLLFFVTAVSVFATGCVTDGTFFGQSKQRQQQQQLEQRKQQVAEINRDNRITDLESSLVVLRSEIDSINSAIAIQNQRLADIEASLARESDTHVSDVEAINSELAAIRAAQTKISASVDAIPQNFTKLLSEQESQIMAQVDGKIASVRRSSSSSSSSSTSAVNYNGPCYEHIVEAGQTLSEIAQAYKVSQKEIMEVNNIRDPSLIRIGQKLYIPKH